MHSIAIFASGNGSNAQRIAEYFAGNPSVRISLILSNKRDAFVLKRAQNLDIPHAVFTRDEFYNSDKIPTLLREHGITFIVLAGFLWLIPDSLLSIYKHKIINIHPALLPKYGGKGMFGEHVHEAVIRNGETESGITIHHVNEQYDAGDIIFQAKCPVFSNDTPESLAHRIHALEYEHYPKVIEEALGTRQKA